MASSSPKTGRFMSPLTKQVTTCGMVRNSVQTLEASKKDRPLKLLGLNLSVDCLTCPTKEKLERRQEQKYLNHGGKREDKIRNYQETNHRRSKVYRFLCNKSLVITRLSYEALHISANFLKDISTNLGSYTTFWLL